MRPSDVVTREIDILNTVRANLLKNWPLHHDYPGNDRMSIWETMLYIIASKLDEMNLHMQVMQCRSALMDSDLVTDLRWFFTPYKIFEGFTDSSSMPHLVVDIPVLIRRSSVIDGSISENDFLLRDSDYEIDYENKTVSGVDLREMIAPIVWRYANSPFERKVSTFLGVNYGEANINPWDLLGDALPSIRSFLSYSIDRDKQYLETLFDGGVMQSDTTIPGYDNLINGVVTDGFVDATKLDSILEPWKVIEATEEPPS